MAKALSVDALSVYVVCVSIVSDFSVAPVCADIVVANVSNAKHIRMWRAECGMIAWCSVVDKDNIVS